MLILRLQRSGKKNKPEFRIVLAQKTAAAGKKFLEVLGNYNPTTKAFAVRSEDRLKYWIAQHVELSPTVHNLLVNKNFIALKKVKAFSVPKKKVEEPVASAAPAAAATEAPEAEAPEEANASPAPESAAAEQPAA